MYLCGFMNTVCIISHGIQDGSLHAFIFGLNWERKWMLELFGRFKSIFMFVHLSCDK